MLRSRIDYGGKKRIAPIIWGNLGSPTVYVEPFAGSLACLLARPGGAGQREIVCDLDGGIVNFWRAMEVDPDEVAYWADYPSFHQDLTARHKWLKEWFVEHASELSDDPHFCDSKVAGWWVWGISLWIGGGWCHVDSDKRPQANNWGTGQGVSAQKITRPDLVTWFRAIQDRLKGVIVLNRSWESALTPTLLMHTPTAPNPPVGILMDPPYITEDRQSELYGSDADGSSTSTAYAAYLWAVENGARFRVAYCCHEGDFPVPDGWTSTTVTFSGINDAARRVRQDMVMFSPACVGLQQGVLFPL